MFAINKPCSRRRRAGSCYGTAFHGVLTMGEALAGFSDPNIVLIAALFVIGDGLVQVSRGSLATG